MKALAPIIAALVLVGCQVRETAPTQPTSDREVTLAARLTANQPLPTAARVRLRLITTSDTTAWLDVAYQSGRTLDLGRVRRGASIVLDVRAYSTVAGNTVWKWFAHTVAIADAPQSIQLVDAPIEVLPTASGISTYDPSGEGVLLPDGSRYTLDGGDPATSTSFSKGSPIVVPPGKVLRALLRSVVPGTEDTLDGDTVTISGTIVDPVTGLHVPRNLGSTNLPAWTARTKGATLSIKARTSSDFTSAAPDSAFIWLRNGENTAKTWRLRYADLATFATDVDLDSASMNAGAYQLQAQFRWTGGARKGDTTELDSRSIHGFAGTVPDPVFEVSNGKTVVKVRNFADILPAPSGWSAVMQADLDGIWHDILDNANSALYPSLRTGSGQGSYPLGTSRLKVFYIKDQDTSVTRIVDIGYSQSIVHDGHTYPIVQYGSRRWISRPMNSPAVGNFCSDRTINSDCGTAGRLYTWLEATKLSSYPDSGDIMSQGVCPSGYRLPSSNEAYSLIHEITPDWTWGNKLTIDMASAMQKARFELRGYSKEDPKDAYWDSPGFWTASTGNGGSHDLFYMLGSSISAISRDSQWPQVASAFCIEEN